MQSKWYRTTCRSCNGMGFVISTNDNKKVECGSCFGEGMYEDANAFMQKEYEIQDSVDRYKSDEDNWSY